MAVLFSKSPNEHLKVTLNWAAELAIDTSTIVSCAWTIPSGLTSVSQTVASADTVLVLSGGTAGVEYSVSARITTNESPATYYEQGVIVSVDAAIAQPSNAYCSVAALAADLGLSSAADIARLATLATEVSRWADAYCGKKFYYEAGIVEKVQIVDSRYFLLKRTPVRSITSITYAGETVAAADYTIEDADTGLVRAEDAVFNRYLLSEGNSYTVTYTGGYYLPGQTSRDLPFDLEAGVAMIASEAWYSRDRDPSLSKMAIPQVISLEFKNGAGGSAGGNSRIFQGTQILDRYRLRRF